MEKEILNYLKNRPNGLASSLEIIDNLSLSISNEDFDSIIENLFYKGFIEKPHPQFRSGSEPKYDLIIISHKGKEFVGKA
jgi:hypothetical protein